MLIFSYDTETTGLKVQEDRIIEVGGVLYDTDARMPLRLYSSFIRPRDPLPEGYVSPTGIKGEWLLSHGVSLPDAYGEVQRILAAMPEVIVLGHNVLNFDKPITDAELAREGIQGHALSSCHWVDTRQDLPLEGEPSSRRLIHMSAEYAKFVNPFEHRALFDALSCIKLLDQFDFAQVLALSKIPIVTIRACTNYEQRELPKALRYAWNGEDGKKYWYKNVRENRLADEEKAAAEKGFKIVRL